MQQDAELARLAHERHFWDHHVLPLDYCLEEYRRGPDPNTATLLDALEPLEGRRVLDFACGAGVLTAWLAARGADVTGIDLSQSALERAHQLLDGLGLHARLLAEDVGQLRERGEPAFDRITGRYALHHVEPIVVAPVLGACLADRGRAAFVETMATNPTLQWARANLVGRLGIPRLGTLDEAPLTRASIEALSASLGSCTIRLGQMAFLRILDRQVLRFRWPLASRLLARTDDVLGRWKPLTFLSYKQVLVFSRG